MPNTEALISIIVPVYNLESELSRCVESILAQSYRRLEIILVDDGSTDGSRREIARLAGQDARIRTICKENGGVTSARLSGAAAAAGEYIGFVDGDDEIEPDMYERLLNNALRFGADISHCGFQMCFADGRIHYFNGTGRLLRQNSREAVRALLAGEYEPGLCNKLFRRSLLERLLREVSLDLTIKNNEDLLMNYYLFSFADRTVYEDFCPYHYLVRAGSASRRKTDEHTLYDPLRVRERILADSSGEVSAWAENALLTTCVYSYCGLTGGAERRTEKRIFRDKIKEHRSGVSRLPGRTGLLARMILYAPHLLEIAYPVYAKHFQEKRYE